MSAPDAVLTHDLRVARRRKPLPYGLSDLSAGIHEHPLHGAHVHSRVNGVFLIVTVSKHRFCVNMRSQKLLFVRLRG